MQMKEKQGVRRVAIIFSTNTIADCPLEGTCVTNIEVKNTTRQVICGHYHGSITNCHGSQIICGYQGE